MTTLPEWGTYCENTTGVNALCFSFPDLEVYFSYKTPVAFRAGGRLVVRQNDWGPTTGKHLNAIDDGAKASRISSVEFEAQLAKVLQSIAA